MNASMKSDTPAVCPGKVAAIPSVEMPSTTTRSTPDSAPRARTTLSRTPSFTRLLTRRIKTFFPPCFGYGRLGVRAFGRSSGISVRSGERPHSHTQTPPHPTEARGRVPQPGNSSTRSTPDSPAAPRRAPRGWPRCRSRTPPPYPETGTAPPSRPPAPRVPGF